ncbi:MAG: transposase [Anaerolineae bacterium]|nr:transposase [Anaerolineae bacterium]
MFGDVIEEAMVLNDVGEIVKSEWKRTDVLRPNVALDEFVVMPNHLHGILIINDVGADRRPPAEPEKRAHISAPLHRKGGTIGSIVAGFKSTSTKQINILRETPNQQIWQRSYHDRIIRNDTELQALREYITSNPMLWAQDDENPG